MDSFKIQLVSKSRMKFNHSIFSWTEDTINNLHMREDFENLGGIAYLVCKLQPERVCHIDSTPGDDNSDR